MVRDSLIILAGVEVYGCGWWKQSVHLAVYAYQDKLQMANMSFTRPKRYQAVKEMSQVTNTSQNNLYMAKRNLR